MGRLAQFDDAALARLLTRQRNVISRSQALACGMSEKAVRHRLRTGGTWQTLLPGIYLTTQGVPTGKQRVMAAFLYPANAIAVTGPAALSYHSIPAGNGDAIDILVPMECRRLAGQGDRRHRASGRVVLGGSCGRGRRSAARQGYRGRVSRGTASRAGPRLGQLPRSARGGGRRRAVVGGGRSAHPHPPGATARSAFQCQAFRRRRVSRGRGRLVAGGVRCRGG